MQGDKVKYKLMEGGVDRYITNINGRYYRLDTNTLREYPQEILSMYAAQLIGEDGKPYLKPKKEKVNEEIQGE
jgi:hypothetical protein